MLKNPSRDGIVIVEALTPVDGKKCGTEFYPTKGPNSKPIRIGTHSMTKDGKFNPKKIVFFAEETIISTKKVTIKISKDGSVEVLPVDSYDPTLSDRNNVARQNDMYGI